ncbi:hypothetical protein CYMTET_23050 [Cymbomonas tetramitiformis]|uniref:Uncharacterized protein n=1 Tax=Cymbomonas tetramitiformis TaxID=36881 RepID=A0AAE0FYL3_9CHLO|nr:hypothetical protein CYMTET_23050 [Cymbomonas tetramitiformis]
MEVGVGVSDARAVVELSAGVMMRGGDGGWREVWRQAVVEVGARCGAGARAVVEGGAGVRQCEAVGGDVRQWWRLARGVSDARAVVEDGGGGGEGMEEEVGSVEVMEAGMAVAVMEEEEVEVVVCVRFTEAGSNTLRNIS